MKKIIALAGWLVVATALMSAGRADDRHVKVDLKAIDGSGITGFVQLTQLPNGGTNVHVQARGLRPGTSYATFHYETADCSAPADLLSQLSVANDGSARSTGKIDEDLDEVGSVSIRLGPDYGTLLACAAVR